MSELDDISIPDATYIRIGQAADMLDLEPYVLRYWESEFDALSPDKTDSGQRRYQREDIELVGRIQVLLYEEMFTIAGARRQLQLERDGKPCYASAGDDASEQSAALETIEDLEAQNVQLSQRIDELNDTLDVVRSREDEQSQMSDERLAAQTETIAALERDLAEARQTIADLESRRGSPGVDERVVSGLHRQLDGLAELAQRPV